MATKRPNDSDDHVGDIDGCDKTCMQVAKRQKTLDEYDFQKGDIPKIQGDKEITPKEKNVHVDEVTKDDNFQNHNINDRSHKDKESKHSHRSRSTGETSRHSGKHKKHTKDKDKDSKSSSRKESTDEKSRYSPEHESRSKSEDSKSSNRRELTYESERRSGKHESEPSQKVEISPVKHKGDIKEEKSLDSSHHREEKKKKLDHLKLENTMDKFEHIEDLKDSHKNESPKGKSKHSDKDRQPTKDEESGRWHRIESPDKKSSHSHKSEYIKSPDKKSTHSHKSEYKPTPMHCDTTKDDFEFFFGMNSPFSQFHPATFVVRDVKYNCAEQFMMHQKAVMFKDSHIAYQILSEPKPLKQKRLGRKVRGFDPHVWTSKCVEIVKEGNIAKFSQNPDLENQLIATHPKIMAESSPRDCLWGIGLGANNVRAWNVKTWRGKNLLGYALMEVRKHIMKTKGLIK